VGCLGSFSKADVDAAFEESGSTADSSTAEGVELIGKAVALACCAGSAFEDVGLLKSPSSVDF
jgi:hypothetical protein